MGAEIEGEKANDADGWTPLMYAAGKGHWYIVEYIVTWSSIQGKAAGVELGFRTQNKIGNNAFMLAAEGGWLNVVCSVL